MPAILFKAGDNHIRSWVTGQIPSTFLLRLMQLPDSFRYRNRSSFAREVKNGSPALSLLVFSNRFGSFVPSPF